MRNKHKWYSILLIGLVLLLASLLVGCDGSPPVINDFSANPTKIIAGESTTLAWSVTGATTVTIDQAIGNVALTGTTAVSPDTTTRYILTASKGALTVTATTQVVVSRSGANGEESSKPYTSSEYGYSLDYPSNWVLEATEPEKVFLWTPHDAPSSVLVFIYVQDFPMFIPLEEAPTDWLRLCREDHESLTILSNHQLENNWDWFLEYTYSTAQDGDETYYEEIYFKRVDSFLYLIAVTVVSTSRPPELQNIIDSFQVTRKPARNGMEFSTYQNTEYGYKIEYPEDWELIDTSPKRTIVGVSWGRIFGFITIHASHFGKPVGEMADAFTHYLADITTDEWQDFEVTYSHSLRGKWDWVIGFTYTDITGSEPVDGCGEAYIVQTPECEFIVQWDSEESQVEICKQIVDSFRLP